MKEKIKEIMAVVFEIEKEDIPDNASPDNIENWDSLHHMNLIVALEEEFDLELDDEDIVEMLNLELIEEILGEKVG